jgi:anti-sigma B factor antagonist
VSVHEEDRSASAEELRRGALRIELESSLPDGRLTVRLHGELDMEGAPLLEQKLIELIAGDASGVVVDMGELRFVDSTGLQSLLAAAANSRANGDKLRFRRPTGQVDDVMRLTEVAGNLPFVD